MATKVLLVEDDNNLREIFEMRLKAEGYDTLTAGDGEEALSVAMKEKPDLIIADVMMPKLSGFEMLETLHAAPEMANTKVVMMTALGQAEDQARGEKLGVVKYLVKSQVTLEDFVRIVREVVAPDSTGAASPAGPAASTAATDDVTSNTSNNQKESEKSMPDDNATPTNPMPMPGAPAPSDGSMPGANPISSTPPAADSGIGMGMPADNSGQMSTAQEQSAVQGQVNDFASSMPSSTPAMPGAADTSMPATPAAPAMPGTDTGAMPPAMPSMPAPSPDAGTEHMEVPVTPPPADGSMPGMPGAAPTDGGTMPPASGGTL